MNATPLALRHACALALGAAVSLGLSRFAYALLLPAMRSDLQWTYLTAGAMNTANAVGYLIGALAAPRWLRHHEAQRVLVVGAGATAVLIALHAGVRAEPALLALRLAVGISAAAVFVAGGLLTARVAQANPQASSGLLLGLYYGGTGLGIVLAAWPVQALLAAPGDWPRSWLALAAAAAAATLLMHLGSRDLHAQAARASEPPRPGAWRALGWGLASYLMFGLGYIGYMTFIITLLRERGWSSLGATVVFTVLGLACMASSWIWAGLLQRERGGRAMALLHALLAFATLLPVLSDAAALVLVSAAVFGGVFLSVVASTTALVRHNLPPQDWPAGIAAFTIVFALGQIVGPSLVGWLADGAGGLARGFAVSAAVLLLGAALGWQQRALPRTGPAEPAREPAGQGTRPP